MFQLESSVSEINYFPRTLKEIIYGNHQSSVAKGKIE